MASTLVNIVFYLILLQACVGFVNNFGIWQVNSAVTINNTYSNVDLRTLPNVQNAGGILNDVMAFGTILTDAVISMIKIIMAMVISVATIYPTIQLIFPWMLTSNETIAFLVILQFGIWFMYVTFLYKLFKGELGVMDI